MKIVFGINAQQQGHFARAALLIPRLREQGHTVHTLTSGPETVAPPPWAESSHRHVRGLPYIDRDGRTDYAATARSWLRSLPRLVATRQALVDWIGAIRPDVILSDFELFTGGPGPGFACPIVSACRQNALLDSMVELPDGGAGRQITRTIVRLFTMGADRRLAYHFAPSSPRCLPPLLRPELRRLAGCEQPRGEHLFVYNSQHFGAGGDADSLIRFATETRRPVIAYGFASQPRGTRGPVTFRPPSRQAFLEDLAGCRAVATTAGFALPLEAALLGKPVLVIPLPGQWEQTVNAFQLESLGLATASTRWDYERLLTLPPPTIDAELQSWLLRPSDEVIEQLLSIARATVN